MSKYTGFSYDFTPGEFAFLLFGKKNCPRCGARMRRIKGFEEADSSILESRSEPIHLQGRNRQALPLQLFLPPVRRRVYPDRTRGKERMRPR